MSDKDDHLRDAGRYITSMTISKEDIELYSLRTNAFYDEAMEAIQRNIELYQNDPNLFARLLAPESLYNRYKRKMFHAIKSFFQKCFLGVFGHS